MNLLGAEAWTYWISFFLFVPAIVIVLGLGVLYLVRVVSTKYPRQ